MSDETIDSNTIGSNSRERMAALARQIMQHEADAAENRGKAKELRTEAKQEGFDLKALNRCIKEIEKGPSYQAAQLELELVLDTYRRALDLPTTLEQAQERAADAAERVPEKVAKAKSNRKGMN
jgi:uncharacterized protein (UPF0335 family)